MKTDKHPTGWTEEPIHPVDRMYEVDTVKLIQYCRYMSKQNMLRSMDLERDPVLAAESKGLASAYNNIVFLVNSGFLLTK